MSGALRVLVAAGVTALFAGLIALGTSLPLPGDPPTEGLLRLDWRLRGEEAGGCIPPSAEVLERLPPHMRNPDACVGGLPPYRLRLWIDGEMTVDRVVRGGGARGDRPLTVYEEIPVPPGPRRVRVEFVPEEAASEEPLAPEGDDPRSRDRGIRLAAEDSLHIEAGQVILAVRRQDTGALVLRSPVR